jgi:L1 cell adhesion molecule like protein
MSSSFLPPRHTAYSKLRQINRRLIGRRFDDDTVKKDIESWPFKVIDREGNPFVQVEYLGETKTFSPQEISAMVLGKVCLILVIVFSYLM